MSQKSCHFSPSIELFTINALPCGFLHLASYNTQFSLLLQFPGLGCWYCHIVYIIFSFNIICFSILVYPLSLTTFIFHLICISIVYGHVGVASALPHCCCSLLHSRVPLTYLGHLWKLINNVFYLIYLECLIVNACFFNMAFYSFLFPCIFVVNVFEDLRCFLSFVFQES